MSSDDGAAAAALVALPTAVVADACLRLGVWMHVAPPGISPVVAGFSVAGSVLPVRHAGSVDVFLEALEAATPGDVLTVDNQGRLDEGCVGDLVALEARAAGLAGIVVWGAVRDTVELAEIALPVFAYGTCPLGPLAARERPPGALESAPFAGAEVTRAHVVVGDGDGVLFLPGADAARVLEAARVIQGREREQAGRVEEGVTLRDQLRFRDFLARRAEDPSYTFRQHLERLGGAIEV